MSRIIWILAFLYAGQLTAQSNIYDVQLESLDSKPIALNEYKGRKILIAVVSPDNLQNSGLTFLDSLQEAFPEIKVLIIPANDFGGERNAEILQSVRNNAAKKTTVAAASYVSKKGEQQQNILVKFLTHVEQNTHFDHDVESDFQIYVVSESGELYAALAKGVGIKMLNEIIHREDRKQ